MRAPPPASPVSRPWWLRGIGLALAGTAAIALGVACGTSNDSESDAGLPPDAAGSDATTDGGQGVDSAVLVEASDDAAHDGSATTPADAALDSALDAGGGSDAGAEAGVDAAAEASVEAGVLGVIVVAPTSGLTTTKAGGAASFTIVLATAPTATVSVGVTSSNTSQGTVAPSSVIFTPGSSGNWATPQTVTITGVNDHAVTGNVAYAIVTAPAVSLDPAYSGVNPPDVSVTSIDTNVANVILSRTAGLTTVENGTSDTFTIKLSTMPSSNVTWGLTTDNTNFGTVSPTSVTFTVANWATAQTVTVTGDADAKGNTQVDGNATYHVVIAAAVSLDPNYNGMKASQVSVTKVDDDIYVYGGDTTNNTSMVWCDPITTCSTNLTVNLPYRGGSANFVISLSGAFHGVHSTAGAAEFADSPALTLSTPYPVTLGQGSHPFDCWVHGPAMSGTLVVP